MNEFDKINYKNHEITIFYDESPQSPDDWGNEDAFLVYDHRDLTITRKGYDPQDIFDNCYSQNKKIYEGYWIFPVYALIHSGIWLSMRRTTFTQGCDPGGWDTSFRGFMLVKRQKGWTYTENKAYDVANSMLTEWNDYLSGNVFGYQTDTDDSVWGYYGNPEKSGIIEDAKGSIDSWLIERAKTHTKQLKSYISKKVPIQYRKPMQL